MSALLRNFGWKTLAEGLSRGLGLLFVILLARLLGEEAFGLYSLPLACAGLLAVLLDPGVHSVLIREAAREPERKNEFLAATIGLRLLSSGAFLLLLLALWPLFAAQVSFAAFAAAGLILLGQSWIDTQIAWLNARQAFRSEARLRFWLKLGLLLPQMLMLWLLPTIEGLLWAGALAHLAWLPILALNMRPDLSKVKIQAPLVKKMFSDGLGFWLANLAWMIYLKLDLVMLPLLGRPAAELGWYQAAIRFYELLFLPAYLLSMAAFPDLSAKRDDRAGFAAARARLQKLSLLLGSALMLGGAGLALLLPWLLGPGFAASVPALLLLCLALPAACLNQSLFAILGARGDQHLTARATALCLIANALLNLLLIPRWGYIGSAIATLIADWLLCSVLVVKARKVSIPCHSRESGNPSAS